MRRIGRHLFTILAAASLLLCFAVLADWCTHPWRTNIYGWLVDSSTTVAFSGGEGQLGFGISHNSSLKLNDEDLGPYYTFVEAGLLPSFSDDSWLERRGFRYFRDPGTNDIDISLPSWFLATLFAILPAVRLRAMLRDRKRSCSGLCPTCGYDLRAHAAGERCPECGTDVRR